MGNSLSDSVDLLIPFFGKITFQLAISDVYVPLHPSETEPASRAGKSVAKNVGDFVGRALQKGG